MTKIRAQFFSLGRKKKGRLICWSECSHHNLRVELGISIERARKFILEKQHTTQRGRALANGWNCLCVGCVRGVARECRVSHHKTVIVMQMEDDDDVEV